MSIFEQAHTHTHMLVLMTQPSVRLTYRNQTAKVGAYLSKQSVGCFACLLSVSSGHVAVAVTCMKQARPALFSQSPALWSELPATELQQKRDFFSLFLGNRSPVQCALPS